jgi:hypothetical protein
MTVSNQTPTSPENGGDQDQLGGASRLNDSKGKLLAYSENPIGDWVTDRVVESVVFVAGVGVAGVVAAWEGTREQREQVNRWITEGLDRIGQYSQERVEAVQNFLSEKSLEKKEPGRPTPENTGGEFDPPKKGATTGKVEEGPMRGKEGWVDKNGDIWVPTNGQAAHGGEHYDVQDPKGRGHRNVYPGGHVRSSIDGIDENPTLVAMHSNISVKTQALLSDNNIAATPTQIDNTVAKVFADAREGKLASVGELHLTTGESGKNIVTLPQGANEFSMRTATNLETAMNTLAKDSYQVALTAPAPEDTKVAAQAIAPKSLS